MRESAGGGAESDLGGDLGSADEQLVRIETARIAQANSQALVVTVAGEIDLYTVDRVRAAVAACRVPEVGHSLGLSKRGDSRD